MDLKRWLAVRRWWIAAITVALVLVRIVVGVGVGIAVSGAGSGTDLAALVTAALDVLALSLAVVTLVAFVQHGRIFKARVPTELWMARVDHLSDPAGAVSVNDDKRNRECGEGVAG